MDDQTATDVPAINYDKLNALAGIYEKEFSSTEASRQQTKEDEWMKALRACKGIHDPEIQFSENESRIYSQYTRSKEVPLRAKLNQHLIPEKEKNWEIVPTPKPRVDSATLSQITGSIPQQDESGNPINLTPEMVERAVKEFTEARARNMSITINDQLTESGYRDETKKAVASGIRYGTGVKKGPITGSYSEIETAQNQFGGWEQRESVKYRPGQEFIPIWRFFPDMSTTEIKQCVFAFELHSKTKHEMRELAARPDFYGDVIYEILKTKPAGNYRVRQWEQLLQTVDPNATTQVKVDSGTTVTASSGNSVTSENYEVLERNGFVDGSDLFEAGLIPNDDVKQEYFVNMWICAGKVIKYFLWPKDVVKDLSELYHLFYYEKDETSIFGTGMPRIIRDRQLTLNAGERHMINHAAWLEGPCGEVDHQRVLPAWRKFLNKLQPGMFFATNGGSAQHGKVFNIYDIQNNMQSYIQFMQFQKAQGDEETSLPTYLFSSPTPGADETARGATIRFTNLIDFVKDLARNFDESNTSLIRGFYRWNMKYNPDPLIKGDMETKAIGSAQALIKDAVRESIGFIMQSLPDEMKSWIKWREFTKELLKSMFDDPEKMMLTDDEWVAEQQRIAQQQQQMAQFQMWMGKVKGEYDMAKSESMLAKAEKTRAEIPGSIHSKQLDNEKKKADITASNLDNVQRSVDIDQSIAGGANGGTEQA